MKDASYISGPLPAKLSNAISDAIHAALEKGMGVDEAACVAVSVAADYARMEYGNSYLEGLALVVMERANKPEPKVSPQ